jgi:hypothetical protein
MRAADKEAAHCCVEPVRAVFHATEAMFAVNTARR